MKRIFKWIIAFILGVLTNGIALMLLTLILTWLIAALPSLFTNIFCGIVAILACYKITDYAFGQLPYRVLKVSTLSLLYVFAIFTFGTVLFAIFDPQYDNGLTPDTKWLLITIRVSSTLAVLSLIRLIAPIAMANKRLD